MGVQLKAKFGHSIKVQEEDLKEELADEEFKGELNKKELQSFAKYQLGTEDLIP